MPNTETSNIRLIREYLAVLETGNLTDLSRFFNPDALQVELPNKLNPAGAQSDLQSILQRAEMGKKILREQAFDVRTILAQGDHVTVEAEWSGVLAVPVAGLEAGATMKAWFAMFFQL